MGLPSPFRRILIRGQNMIEYKNFKKSYGEKQIIKGINLTIEKGEFVVIIGPSGCGKTTTVKALNRLVDEYDPKTLINGVNTAEIDLIKLRTSIGYVIQQIGLFPNMTVEQNISVVPKIMKWEKQKILDRVKELMKMVHMPYEEYGKKYPRQLSGGQQQRIGVLRALAVNPPIMIMDEPFGALDPITREILQEEIKKIQRKLKITVLFITHDMHEAMKLADKIVFMDEGQILQEASPRELFLHPVSEKIAQFIRLQEVQMKDEQLTAADLMQKIPTGGLERGAQKVLATESLSSIAARYVKGTSRVYVTDDNGTVIGEITAESLLHHMAGRCKK